jgi:hypothetical protein
VNDAEDLPDSAEEWSRDKFVRLTELYRDVPALYDMTVPGYFCSLKKTTGCARIKSLQ